ncbi:MAG: UPF0280 family protein [candidate division WS1 bacterium]|jgi:ApbE superfamily uncharacterized protein (UPF0280 family)|nr:UPF0280 family protein [candidate division WS1 bacterium]
MRRSERLTAKAGFHPLGQGNRPFALNLCSMNPHEPRRYRGAIASEGLVGFEVSLFETDLMVLAERDLRTEARFAARNARRQIESHAAMHPGWVEARTPVPVGEAASPIVKAMSEAARVAGTGPMAAVAGAIAEEVARALVEHSAEVIVENGGDIFMITGRERLVAIGAGRSRWQGKLALAVPAGERAICTSSGTVGHSVSAGRADAVVMAAPTGALADALATATGNRVGGPADVRTALEWAAAHEGVEQVVVICGEAMAVWGTMDLRAVGE